MAGPSRWSLLTPRVDNNLKFWGFAIAASFSAAMIIIGALYLDPARCKLIGVPHFLIVGGSTYLALAVLALVLPYFRLTSFCVLIYGSIVVFSKYATWDYKNPSSATFCAYTPFMFAFLVLIFEWVFELIFICALLVAICYYTTREISEVTNGEEPAKRGGENGVTIDTSSGGWNRYIIKTFKGRGKMIVTSNRRGQLIIETSDGQRYVIQTTMGKTQNIKISNGLSRIYLTSNGRGGFHATSMSSSGGGSQWVTSHDQQVHIEQTSYQDGQIIVEISQ